MENTSSPPTTDKHKRKRKRRRRDYIAPGFGVLVIAIVVITGWAQRNHTREMRVADEATLKAQLGEMLPHDIAVSEARSALVSRGFDCVAVPPETFADVQALLCDRQDPMPSGKPLRWQLVVKADKSTAKLTDYVIIRR